MQSIDKLENQLRQEKWRTKHIQFRLKNYRQPLFLGIELINVQATKKLLEEKEKTIQVLKKKLKAPGT